MDLDVRAVITGGLAPFLDVGCDRGGQSVRGWSVRADAEFVEGAVVAPGAVGVPAGGAAGSDVLGPTQ